MHTRADGIDRSSGLQPTSGLVYAARRREKKEKTLCRLGLALRHKGYGRLLRFAARKMEIYMFVSVFLILRTRAESEDGKK